MCQINCSGGCPECAPEDHGLVKFFAFSAGEFEDEELWHQAEYLATVENRTHEDVEKEFKEKLVYIKNNGHHAFETWGPQELADRLNKATKAWLHKEAKQAATKVFAALTLGAKWTEHEAFCIMVNLGLSQDIIHATSNWMKENSYNVKAEIGDGNG